MNKGIYIALSGALLKKRQLDISAQNIANSTTSGFKKERITFKDVMIPVDNQPANVDDGRAMSGVSDVVTDFSFGSNISTGNPLDVSINGEGFFALENNLYTRSGNFKIDSEGNLVTKDGRKVMGSGGAISIQGSSVEITSSGEVLVDGLSAGKLKIMDFPDRSVLKKLDGGVFTTEEQGTETDTGVSQGFLEASNVEIIHEMVQMISSLRDFEAYQKLINMFDDAASKTVNQLGK